MKTCKQLIEEFNLVAAQIPPLARHKIMGGQEVYESDCGDAVAEVQTAGKLWQEILKRVGEYPDYSTMVQ
jgi:hypothetical protein